MAGLTEYRRLFPVTRELCYLNHAAMSPISQSVVDRMNAHLLEAARHALARIDAWEESLERTRGQCARLIGARAEEIAFVRNTSHGLSLVAEGLRWRAGDNVLCATSEEYPSNVYPWRRLASRGVELRDVPAPGGRLEVEAFARAGDERTRLVTVSSVQYASGWRMDLEGLGRLCEERGWLLCVDGIQSVGAIPLDVKAARIHFLSADSHKWMLGLPGIGVFYVDARLAAELEPPLIGWRAMKSAFDFDRARLELREDAGRFEEGNLPYALIEGLGGAVDLFLEVGMERVWGRILELNDFLIRGLLAGGHEVTVALEPAARSGIVLFKPKRGNPAELAAHLQRRSILVSCRRGQIRVSPHFYNTEEELERLLHEVERACADSAAS